MTSPPPCLTPQVFTVVTVQELFTAEHAENAEPKGFSLRFLRARR